MDEDKLIDELLAQGFTEEEIIAELSAAPAVAAGPNLQRENAVNTETPGEFNGILDNPIVRGIGTTADYLGGVTRLGLRNLAEEAGLAEDVVTIADIDAALNPFDNKDAISSAEIIRRSTGEAAESGTVQASDLGGFAADIATDPLSYLTLGALPVAKGLQKFQKPLEAALRATGKAVTKPTGGAAKQTARVLGRLLGKDGSIVDNFVKDPEKFLKLNKTKDPERLVGNALERIVGRVNRATKKFTTQEKSLFRKELDKVGKVDATGLKDDLRKLKANNDPNLKLNNEGVEEALQVNKAADNILGKEVDKAIKPKNSLEKLDQELGLAPKKAKAVQAIPDELTSDQAIDIYTSLEKVRSVSPNATSAEKLVAGKFNNIAKKFREKQLPKRVSKRYKKNVIDLQSDVQDIVGKVAGDSVSKQAKKLQTNLKSASRSDNFAQGNSFRKLDEALGTNLRQDAKDFRTLDLVGGRVGRLVEANSEANLIKNVVGGTVGPIFRNTASGAQKLSNTSGAIPATLINRLLLNTGRAGQNN